MNKIICLVGESGAGKSAIAELLEKDGYNYIQSFTTRKERYPGEKGHIYTTEKQYSCNKANNTIVAETVFDNNRYWTTRGQFNGTSIYVVDPVGIKGLKEKLKDAEIIVIYLKCSKQNRFIRMMARDKNRDKVLKRIEHDEVAFKDVEADHIVNCNKPLESVFREVKGIVRNILVNR